MNNLLDAATRDVFIVRIRAVQPQTTPQWGRMSASQMLCHCSDAFRGVLGEKAVAPVGTAWHHTVVKWIALHAPIRYPQNYSTMPEMDQHIGGTAPSEFERDRDALIMLVRRFSDLRDPAVMPEHALFGRLTMKEWGKWAFRHTDHHLRQFGV